MMTAMTAAEVTNTSDRSSIEIDGIFADHAGLNRASISALKEICCCQLTTNPTKC